MRQNGERQREQLRLDEHQDQGWKIGGHEKEEQQVNRLHGMETPHPELEQKPHSVQWWWRKYSSGKSHLHGGPWSVGPRSCCELGELEHKWADVSGMHLGGKSKVYEWQVEG